MFSEQRQDSAISVCSTVSLDTLSKDSGIVYIVWANWYPLGQISSRDSLDLRADR